MTTVDDAVEAGARAISERENCGYCEGGCGDCSGDSMAAIAAAWPVLTAPIRELHTKVVKALFPGGEPRVQCGRCQRVWPCPDMQLIIETDFLVHVHEMETNDE